VSRDHGCRALLSLVCAAALLFAAVLSAQSPIGSETRITDRQLFSFPVGLAYMADGTLVASFQEDTYDFVSPDPLTQAGFVRRLSLSGELGSEEELIRVVDTPILFLYSLIAFPGGGYEVFFELLQQDVDRSVTGVRFDANYERVGGLELPDTLFLATTATQAGNVALVGAKASVEFSTPMLTLVSPDGAQLRRPRRLAQNFRSQGARHKVATDSLGRLLVVWEVPYELVPPYRSDLRARSVELSGALGPEFQVTERTSSKHFPVVAEGSDGTFWIAWQEGTPGAPGGISIRAQKVTPAGVRVGREMRVTPGGPDAHYNPGITSDPSGNVLITWFQDSFDPGGYGCRGRLYRPDGNPVGRPFSLARSGRVCGGIALSTFNRNGVFAALWPRVTSDENPNAEYDDLYVTRFSASPADEVCWLRAGHLLCDLGRTGGEAENDETIPEGTGSRVWMADVDGDGRADPCVLVGSELRCDLEHEGVGSSWRHPVTVSPGATLLLGDVDGDGKADPCTWLAGEFRCTTQAGPLLSTRFGQAGDVPLLGDLNGDHRADLCLHRGNAFLCDTGHDGRVAERTIAFGLASDVPALGDFDGDGRADPCLLRRARVLCDTRHDGGLAEGRLSLAIRFGEPLLIANLDGL